MTENPISPENPPLSICPHLKVRPEDYCWYHLWFTGHEKDCYWVCEDCANQFPVLPDGLLQLSDEFLELWAKEVAYIEGIKGNPELKVRSSNLCFEHRDCEQQVPADFIDIQPNLASMNEWFVLLSSGDLVIWSPETSLQILYRLCDPAIEIEPATKLYIARASDFAALFIPSKRHAEVFDLKTGKLTAHIDRGGYRPETSHFPIDFFEHNGKTLLVAATDWNRLDILDPGSGVMLTARGPTSYKKGERKPDHYLDYFHGQLLVSPGGNWIADNGWVWSPTGIVRSWNMVDWLEKNLWESEDGPSERRLAYRRYCWDEPICWINDETIAIWGWGDDDEWMIPAVRLFDVRTGKELYWFAGPEKRDWQGFPSKKTPPSLFFDEYLFSIRDQSGISVWDVATGERLLHDQSLAPIHYHPNSKDFLTLNSGRIRLSRLSE